MNEPAERIWFHSMLMQLQYHWRKALRRGTNQFTSLACIVLINTKVVSVVNKSESEISQPRPCFYRILFMIVFTLVFHTLVANVLDL